MTSHVEVLIIWCSAYFGALFGTFQLLKYTLVVIIQAKPKPRDLNYPLIWKDLLDNFSCVSASKSLKHSLNLFNLALYLHIHSIMQ